MYFTSPFYEAFLYLGNFLYYYCRLASLLSLRIPRLWVGPVYSKSPQHHVQSYSEGGKWRDIDKYLDSLDDAYFAGLGSNSSARIVSWDLSSAISPFQYEGLVTKAPILRGEVKEEDIGQGKNYSGIFKLESHFELPNGGEYIIKGTAFAVSKFYALTSAHLMWHRKLGPAKWAVLIPDKRQHRSAERVKNCVAVACHASPIKSLKGQEQYAKNDFCMVALAEAFDPGVRILQYHPEPSAFSDEEGLIIGFPKDMPEKNPGEHLILSTGLVSCTEENGVLSIEHRINTVEGNSGGPVIVGGKVVGIHSVFLEDQRRNAAAPVNRNGNNIEEFMGVLRYRRGQHSKLPKGVKELGEATGVTHPGRVLSLLI